MPIPPAQEFAFRIDEVLIMVTVPFKQDEIPSEVYDSAYLLSDLLEGYTEYLEGTLSATKQEEFRLLEVKPELSVLDVGYGRGEFLLHCARAGATVSGIDYSEDACRIARETLSAVSGADIRLGDCRSLPFADESFDRVFSGDVIEHMTFDDAVKAVQEMKRVLRPGGILLIHTSPNVFFTKGTYLLIRPLLKLFDRQTVKILDDNRQLNPYHIKEHSLFSLRRLARSAQLTGADIWISKDILRSGTHRFTKKIARSWPGKIALRLGSLALVRLFLGNDLYVKYHA